MKIRGKQILSGFFLACMLMVIMPVVSLAATGKITFTDLDTEVGQEVSINMRVSTEDGSLGQADIMLAYDSSALEFIEGNGVEGGAGALRAHGGPDTGDLKNIVFVMKFRVLKPGTSQITISSCEVYDSNTQAVSISHQGTSAITAAGAEIEAADGFLASLAVVPGTLTPAFSPAVDTYSIHVGMDVESVEVQALAAEGSTVTIEGNEGLQMGENTITIKVTASDGITVKNYTISVDKSEGGESAVPQAAVQGVSLEAAAKAITILEPEADAVLPEGFTATTIDIDGYKATGFIWTAESNHQYCVFYAMNAAGEKNFYRYDLTEKTIQRYFQDPAIDTGISQEDYIKVAEDYNSLLEDYKIRLYLIIALAAVVAILLIIVVVLLVSRKPEPYRGRERERGSREEHQAAKSRAVSREERYLRGEEEREDTEETVTEEAHLQNTEFSTPAPVQEKAEEEFTSVEIDTPEYPEEVISEAAASEQRKTEDVDDDFELLDI